MSDIEKVIKGLEDIQKHLDTGYSFAISWKSELIRDTLTLLKEQEPKPIVYTDNPYTGLPVAHCPKCGEPIQLYAYGNGAEQNYCPYCGQAVKWLG